MTDTATPLHGDCTLLLIDLQRAILAPTWGTLSNPGVGGVAGRLLAYWRQASRPLVHVMHHSIEPGSPYRPGQEGVEPLPEVAPLAGEAVVIKSAHSAFVGTDLEQRLRRAGCGSLLLAGVLTHNSLDATARHAADLGFRVTIVPEATSAAAKRDVAGRLWSADEVQALSLSFLAGEYAELLALDALLLPVPEAGV